MRPATIQPGVLDALEGVMSLLHPGAYGVSDADPKARLIRDLSEAVAPLSTPPVIIGGIAVILNGYTRQTVDVDLLVARQDAMSLVRALEAGGRFRRKALDRWVHADTGAGLDLCVEGELTHPSFAERFPSPRTLDTIVPGPLPVAGLVGLLALKAQSGRARDEADFIMLIKPRVADDALRTAVLSRLKDPRVAEMANRWWDRAREESRREEVTRPTWESERP